MACALYLDLLGHANVQRRLNDANALIALTQEEKNNPALMREHYFVRRLEEQMHYNFRRGAFPPLGAAP
jgi:hypothetical protein